MSEEGEPLTQEKISNGLTMLGKAANGTDHAYLGLSVPVRCVITLY